jgi:hypothetical protein
MKIPRVFKRVPRLFYDGLYVFESVWHFHDIFIWVLFGNSVGGTGYNKGYKASTYSEKEELVALDDQFYIFHRTVIEIGAFVPFIPEDVAEWYTPDNNKQEHEWVHSNCWKSRNIHLNVIGIDILFERRYDIYAASGNLNC